MRANSALHPEAAGALHRCTPRAPFADSVRLESCRKKSSSSGRPFNAACSSRMRERHFCIEAALRINTCGSTLNLPARIRVCSSRLGRSLLLRKPVSVIVQKSNLKGTYQVREEKTRPPGWESAAQKLQAGERKSRQRSACIFVPIKRREYPMVDARSTGNICRALLMTPENSSKGRSSALSPPTKAPPT